MRDEKIPVFHQHLFFCFLLNKAENSSDFLKPYNISTVVPKNKGQFFL